MTDNNNWPGKPGVPLNPERDGWHWVKTGHGLSLWRWEENSESIMWDYGWETADGLLSAANFAAMEPCIYIGPCLAPAEVEARVSEARRVALFDAQQRALLYANTSHQHGHLPVDPHECAGQVATEIARSISAIDPDIRKAGYAFRCKVLETAAQKAEMVIATGGPWPNIPAAIRALKGEGDE